LFSKKQQAIELGIAADHLLEKDRARYQRFTSSGHVRASTPPPSTKIERVPVFEGEPSFLRMHTAA
jgi:hypothetical protein